MPKYNTKQKSQIYQILIENKDKMLSIKEIRQLLIDSKIFVGDTTVYRYINELFSQSKVIKSLKNTGVYEYQLIDENNDDLHLKCEKCGKLIHLNCIEINKIKKHLEVEHKFKLKYIVSSLIGICEECEKGME